MPTMVSPEIGSWYFDRVENRQFEIVALDEQNGLIEVQFFDGEIQELDYDVWFEMEILASEAPEDWTGPYEVEGDDTGIIDTVIHPENWSDPFAEIEPESFTDQMTFDDE